MTKIFQTALVIFTFIIMLVFVIPSSQVNATQVALFTVTKEDNLTPQVLAGATQSGQQATGSALPNAGSLAPTLVLAGLGILLTAAGCWRLQKNK